MRRRSVSCGGALALGYIGPIVVCRCARTGGGPVACTISERDLGIVPIRTQSLMGVNAVDVESLRDGGSCRRGGRPSSAA